MKKTFSKKKSAFSLIELSIVLIVIGLLIAGITGGASLIKSSELRSVMGEARGYAVAVNAFYSQFNALPGDYRTALGTVTAIGDGDDRIEYYSDASAPVAEGLQAWLALKAIGGIDSTITLVAVGVAQVPTTNMPASKTKSSGWAFDYNKTSTQNVVVLTGATTTGTATDSLVNGLTKVSPAILATDALSIDAKIDDGVANTGKVRGVDSAATVAAVAADTCSVTTAYTVARTAKTCALSYQVDVNS